MSIDQYTKCLMHFDSSPTRDECGNVWTASGTPTISDNAKFGKSLALNYTDYIQSTSGITLFDSDFTIDGWAYIKDPLTIQNEDEITDYYEPDSRFHSFSTLFSFFQNFSPEARKNRFHLEADNYLKTFTLSRYDETQGATATLKVPLDRKGMNYKEISYYEYKSLFNTYPNGISVPYDQWFHFAVVFSYSTPSLNFFINGVSQYVYTPTDEEKIALLRTPITYTYLAIGFENTTETAGFVGNVDEFRILKGAACWENDFTPPYKPYTDPMTIPTLEHLTNTLKRINDNITAKCDTIEVNLADYIKKVEASSTYIAKAELSIILRDYMRDYKNNALNPELSLSTDTAVIVATYSDTVDVSSVSNGAISAKSADTNIATVSVNDQQLTITGVASGTTTATVTIDTTDTYASDSIVLPITIENQISKNPSFSLSTTNVTVERGSSKNVTYSLTWNIDKDYQATIKCAGFSNWGTVDTDTKTIKLAPSTSVAARSYSGRVQAICTYRQQNASITTYLTVTVT